jgi:hypothetical protein
MKLKTVPIFLVVSLIIGNVYAATNSVFGSTAIEAEPTGEATNTKYLEITDHSYAEGLLFTIVNGTIFNNSSSTINLAIVVVEFYDDSNRLITIGSATADFPILNPGANTTFNIRSELDGEDVDHYIVKPGGNIAP